MKRLTLFTFCALNFANALAQANKQLETTVLAQANQMAKLLISKDYNSFAAYANPVVFTLLKTDQKGFADKMRQQMMDLNKRSASYKYIKFGTPAKIIDTANTLQCIIPEIICITAAGHDYLNHNSMFALSKDHGKKWVFLEVNPSNMSELRKALPIMSSKHIIPQNKVDTK